MMLLTLEIPISMTKDWFINGRCDDSKYKVFMREQNTNPSKCNSSKAAFSISHEFSFIMDIGIPIVSNIIMNSHCSSRIRLEILRWQST